eukprot:Awhi_evm2s9050
MCHHCGLANNAQDIHNCLSCHGRYHMRGVKPSINVLCILSEHEQKKRHNADLLIPFPNCSDVLQQGNEFYLNSCWYVTHQEGISAIIVQGNKPEKEDGNVDTEEYEKLEKNKSSDLLFLMC